MDEKSRDRVELTPAELDELLRRVAAVERGEALRSEDLLDFVEGKATKEQTESVHRALSSSAALRTEVLAFLGEVRDFDVERVNAAIANGAAVRVPAIEDLRSYGGSGEESTETNHAPKAPVLRLRPWHKWGWALAAAAALVLMLQFRGDDALPPLDRPVPATVAAATRAFDPGVRRGPEDLSAIEVTLTDAPQITLAVWIPESWATITASQLALAVSIDGSPPWTPAGFDVSSYEGDAAVLVVLQRERLHVGALAIELRVGERRVVADFRLLGGN